MRIFVGIYSIFFMQCNLKRKRHFYENVAANSKDTGKCKSLPAEISTGALNKPNTRTCRESRQPSAIIGH
jgi:hypothetical protein